MLDYGWVSGEETGQDSDNHHVYDPYGVQSYSEAANYGIPEVQFGAVAGAPNSLPFHGNPTANFQGFYEAPAVPPYQNPSMLTLEPSFPMGYMVVPKSEPAGSGFDFSSRLGLNLGGRTYFASAEDDFLSRLYRRSRILDTGTVNVPRCQAEGCNADLSHAKHYHRRHKVCEFHSKAGTVVVGGLTQRFCQQCSRFHVLSEFDNGKRSCRKRLADHNRRRRKSQRANEETSKSHIENTSDANSPSENMSRSPPESGQHSSSLTAAISLDHPPHRSYAGGCTTSSTASTSSLFYSND